MMLSHLKNEYFMASKCQKVLQNMRKKHALLKVAHLWHKMPLYTYEHLGQDQSLQAH